MMWITDDRRIVKRAIELIGLVITLAVVWVGLRSAGSAPRPASLILITLDTTRADYLPPYESEGLLPAVERLAREGVVFDQAIASVPLTLPSHSSLFTGQNPPAHDVRVNATVLAPGVPTLAESLRTAGYRTAAFVGSVVLDPDRGLARGFDVYRDVNGASGQQGRRRLRRPADEVIDDALGWLPVANDSPFFMWVHLFDAHAPYAGPESSAGANGASYAGALAFMDSQIARLVAALESRGMLDRTAMIVTADHGESLGEHGERGHGIFVYESALRVPLIVRWPGVTPRRVPRLVQLIDVAPTVLALEGVAAPPMDGVNLVPLLRGRATPDRHGYAESMYPLQYGWSALRTVRAGRFKLIEAPRPELYDLEADPHEQQNVFDAHQAEAQALVALLRTFGPADSRPDLPERPEVRERLSALGYVSPAGRPAPAGPPALWPDPKDMIDTYNTMTEKRMRLQAR
jgi:choline-sulfatase